MSTLSERLLNSSVTKAFGQYFKMYRETCPEKWGYFHRVGLGINTNVFCEAFHRVFKYNYLKGKVNQRVDHYLVNLVKYNGDQMFERIIKVTKGKANHRFKYIQVRHRSSARMCFTVITESEEEDMWKAASEDAKRSDMVRSLDEKCDEK